ncbi:MAG TPA: hypothetical protein VF889_04955 [Bacteroidota bacterium]
MNLPVACLLVTVACFEACLEGCTASGSLPAEKQPENRPAAPGDRTPAVAPDRCRLVITVLSIDSVREAAGPCSRVPCTAVVRIDSILAYGFAFPPVLRAGQTVPARFVFTTQRSDLWFPALSRRYPGVTTGSQLAADAELSGSPDAPSASSGLIVDDYALRQ